MASGVLRDRRRARQRWLVAWDAIGGLELGYSVCARTRNSSCCMFCLSRTSDTSGGFCVSCFISTHETPFTARMDYYLGCSIEIGKCGVAHEWFQCYDKRYFEKCPKHYFRYTNSNPVPTHMNFVRKKSGFFGKKLVDHTTSHIIKYSPISILCPR